MRMYLLHSDNTWSNLGFYESKPLDSNDGTWVEGEPIGIEPFQFLSLAEQLSQIFDQQPVSVRAQFAPIRAAIKNELDLEHYDVVQAIIQNTAVASDLEALKQQLLDKLSEVVQS